MLSEEREHGVTLYPFLDLLGGSGPIQEEFLINILETHELRFYYLTKSDS